MKCNGIERLVRWLTAMGIATGSAAFANHPVLVEGNSGAGPGALFVTPGTCGDFDGDGRIGKAEDTDNDFDGVFGTLTAALGAANGGANQNGRVTIVTSGRFAEQVTITGANGNVTLEAAPGVEANIDAVLLGDSGSAMRQGLPGIVVTAEAGRRITLRNLVVRNWTSGIVVGRCGHALIDNCRIENNRDYGVKVMNDAKVSILRTQVTATGFRVGSAADNVANPGIGIAYGGNSTGLIAETAVTMSYGSGIQNDSVSAMVCRTRRCNLFDNSPDVTGTFDIEP